MKKSQIEVGGRYNARVSGRFVVVQVNAIREITKHGGRDYYSGESKYRDVTVYDVTNLTTNRKLTFQSAAKFRSVALSEAKISQRNEHIQALRNVRELFAQY